ncbi:hypothetical protein SDRG_11312 [Saprolegnia diclina VS20]|uniref:Uncharacterized protein n=1 Tax=Saprolegnia diclina (strain VS20) TaxID=1156394 RepID=T0RMB7_SAPDV|nr:hypothetical protein SDRG_11312 [Saprolegnia diclina VS20]EQC31127.1 hypothetical protein SDRG_11312 [Saprolegnia diclina VS20]|eukprot:XP_008615566.1 hypothetical protein SDRG_11312 [Saprolegnia diclina VS20]
MARTTASRARSSNAPPTTFRGYCLYKTGKCFLERALKTNGQPHNLCDLHRLKQNQNQRRLDWKVRAKQAARHEAMVTSPAVRFQPAPESPTLWAPQSAHDPTARAAYRAQVIQQLVRLVSEEVLASDFTQPKHTMPAVAPPHHVYYPPYPPQHEVHPAQSWEGVLTLSREYESRTNMYL